MTAHSSSTVQLRDLKPNERLFVRNEYRYLRRIYHLDKFAARNVVWRWLWQFAPATATWQQQKP